MESGNERLDMNQEFRSGIGYDSHRLAEGRTLILGGITIPFEKGLVGHSDGDIIFHALTDALLGAAGLGDIGQFFPASDTRWKDVDSTIFLEHAASEVRANGYRIVNVDVIVVLEEPRLEPFRDCIRDRIATVLDVAVCRVGVKAKTAEGLGPVGAGLSAEAHTAVTIARPESGD